MREIERARLSMKIDFTLQTYIFKPNILHYLFIIILHRIISHYTQ